MHTIVASRMASINRGTYHRNIWRGRVVSAVLVLLCFMDICVFQALSDPLHPHLMAHNEKTRSIDSSLLPPYPPETRSVASTLVNQHALLQVRVTIGCILMEATNDVRHDLFQGHGKEEAMLGGNARWFVMITELPRSNDPVHSSIHLDQAVDLKWSLLDEGSYKGTASLSFLIPLEQDTATSGERTLIVSLMDHSKLHGGHSRIATRRLANLPMSTSSITTENMRTNQVVTIELSTSTTCVPINQRDAKWRDETTRSNQPSMTVCVIVVLLMSTVVYFYPNKAPQFVPREGEEFSNKSAVASLPQDLSSQNECSTDDPASLSPVRLRRAVVIDSPGSDGQYSTASIHENEIVIRDSAARAQDSSSATFSDSSASRARSRIVKPPSLVRIPYSFVAEQVNESSNLSVDSIEQRSGDVCGSHREAFLSPVVDVNENGANDAPRSENKIGQIAMEIAFADTPVDSSDKVSTNGAIESAIDVGRIYQDAFPSPVIDVKESNATEIDLSNEKSVQRAVDMSFKLVNSCATPKICESVGTNTKDIAITESNVHQTVSSMPDNAALPQSTSRNLATELPNIDFAGNIGKASGAAYAALESLDASKISKSAPMEEANGRQPGVIHDQPSCAEACSLGFVKGAPKVEADETANHKPMHVTEVNNASTHSIEGEGMIGNQLIESEPTMVAAVEDKSSEEPSSSELESHDAVALEKTTSNCEVLNDGDASVAVFGSEQPRPPEPGSKVLDVESVPVHDSNWLRRLRDCPATITSSSVAQSLPARARSTMKSRLNSTNDIGGEKRAKEEGEDGELSYVSTLPPDSESNDGTHDFPDFSFDYSPFFDRDHGAATNENLLENRGTSAKSGEGLSRPVRRKRRLGLLKNRNSDDQGLQSESVSTQHVRPDKARSRMHKSIASQLPTLAAAAQKTAAPEPRPKKASMEAKRTIVPDVVPSTFLQSFANQIDAPVPWDFTKSSSRSGAKKNTRSKGNRRRKRKDPPSTIVILDDSPFPLGHESVISRGSSKVPQALSQAPKGKRRRKTAMGKDNISRSR